MKQEVIMAEKKAAAKSAKRPKSTKLQGGARMKNAYMKFLDEQLKALDKEMAVLKKKKAKLSKEGQKKYKKTMDALTRKKTEAKALLKDAKSAWRDISGGVERAWKDLQRSVLKARKEFK
jgi:hypothetical protein